MTEHELIDPAGLADTRAMGIVGPDYWTYAQVKDWILLCPDIPHVDVRVYGVFRSLATRYRNLRRLTKDQVRFLVPGVNGKPMSKTAFDDSLRRLGKAGLVVIERGSTHVRAARNTATGRFEQVEELLFRVNELPTEGMDYPGWHTVQEALEAYPGPGWDTDPDAHRPRSDRGRISGEGDARYDQEERDVSAAHTGPVDNRKSGSRGRISGDRGRKSGSGKPSTSEKPPSHTGVPDSSSIPPPPAPSVRPQPEEEEEEDVAAFWEAMPGDYRPGRAKRAGVGAEVRRLLRTRTPQALADEVMSAPRPRDGVRLPVRWVLSVLPELPDHPPAAGAERAGTLPPACPACLANNPAAQANPRWRYRDGRMCDCHPDAARAGYAQSQPEQLGTEATGVASAAG